MKNTIKMSAVLLSVLFIAGCGTTNPIQDQAPIDDPAQKQGTSVETPKTQANGLNPTVTVPEGWEPVEGSVLKVQYLKGTTSFMAKPESFNTTDLDEVTKQAITMLKNAFKNVETIGQTEKITVDGEDARKFLFTAEVAGLKMKYEYVYVLVDNQIYAITFGGSASDFDNLLTDYQAILDGIKF